MECTQNTQSTQNNKFSISFQYFKNYVRDKYDFWHEDKHQSFLQAGGIVFTGHSQQYAKYPKQQVCNIFAISQKITEG